MMIDVILKATKCGDLFENNLIDLTNHFNDFQGSFRYGFFDLDLFKKSLDKDLKKLYNKKVKKSIGVSHLDTTDNYIVLSDTQHLLTNDFVALFKDFNFYGSYGVTRQTLKELRSLCLKINLMRFSITMV